MLRNKSNVRFSPLLPQVPVVLRVPDPVPGVPAAVPHPGLAADRRPRLHGHLLLEVQDRTAQRQRGRGVRKAKTRSLLQVSVPWRTLLVNVVVT